MGIWSLEIKWKRGYGRLVGSMVLFQPHKARQTYSKKYLHPDEEQFFVSGQNFPGLKINETNIALTICYELSVADHAEQTFRSGAEIYITSVAKSVNGADKASKRLSDIASTYSMTVMMSNCIGLSDDFECAGKISIWNDKGLLVGQLNGTNEGIIIFDTDANQRAICPAVAISVEYPQAKPLIVAT